MVPFIKTLIYLKFKKIHLSSMNSPSNLSSMISSRMLEIFSSLCVWLPLLFWPQNMLFSPPRNQLIHVSSNQSRWLHQHGKKTLTSLERAMKMMALNAYEKNGGSERLWKWWLWMEKKWLWIINEKLTPGLELWALNGKKMTLGHKWKIDSRLRTLGSKWKNK